MRILLGRAASGRGAGERKCWFSESDLKYFLQQNLHCIFVWTENIKDEVASQDDEESWPRWSSLRIYRAWERVRVPKRMNFRKTSKGGEGEEFSIQKFMLQILGALIHPIWYRHPSLRIELGIFGDIWHSFHRSVPYFIAQNEREGGKGFLNNVQKQHCNIDSQGLPLLALWQKVQKVSATHQ